MFYSLERQSSGSGPKQFSGYWGSLGSMAHRIEKPLPGWLMTFHSGIPDTYYYTHIYINKLWHN